MELSLVEKQMAKQALNLEPEEGEQCALGSSSTAQKDTQGKGLVWALMSMMWMKSRKCVWFLSAHPETSGWGMLQVFLAWLVSLGFGRGCVPAQESEDVSRN